LVELLRSRGAPIAVSCLLHLGLATGLVVGQHWVSAAIRPPVLPVQLVTLETQEESPREAPPPPPVPRAPIRPPRLIEAPGPQAMARAARPETPPPSPAQVTQVAPPPTPEPVSSGTPLAAAESPAALANPTTTIVSSLSGAPAPAVAAVGPSAAATSESVTRQARPQGGYQVRPSYPATPRRLGIQGTTLLRVHVLADGRIGDVLVEKSAGHPELDDAATDAVKRWRFDPARRGSDAVAMWVLLPVEFKLR
jgi:periplasmic protein TonB